MTSAVEERDEVIASEAPATEQPIDEQPIHGAVCDECKHTVAFRMLGSGAGFAIINHGYAAREVSFGVGPNNRPECPLGHGEMTIADDKLPASEAISQVAERVNGPQQAALPGVIEFNKPNAYDVLETMFVERDAAKKIEDEDHERYKRSKKARETLDEKINIAGLEFRRRRVEKTAGPAAVSTALERCRFEQLHPGVPCPLCTDPTWQRTTAPASEEHGVDAHNLLIRRECEETVELLKSIPHVGFTVDDLLAMDLETRSILEAWVRDYADHPDRRDELMAERPRPIDTAHKAGPYDATEPSAPDQLCRECGAVLFTVTETDPALYEGTLVGTGCEGKAKKVGHRYPKGKKKAQTRRQRAEAES